jgi:general L-amino acid transport system ATP-binding protein
MREGDQKSEAEKAPPGAAPAARDGVAIEIAGLDKWFGTFHVLRGIDLTVMRGERIVICGPSGSGKSTLLRCINRLDDWQRGRIMVDGVELSADIKKIEEVRREVGMVFQQFNLFPHLTVLENCTLAPIWVRRMPRKEAEDIARHQLARVRIPEMVKEVLDSMVALALDGMTMLVVSHEMGFARQVADRMILMDAGQIIEMNDPAAFFDHPQHERTKQFLQQILR